jgi:DNA-binding NtrC family response regulator
MNILFIEDERDLLDVGVAQLEQNRYHVYPVTTLKDAREIMLNPSMPVHMVLADHRLPDGQGVDFVIEMKAHFPQCIYAIVSGCLTDRNISVLVEHEIPYYHKPLLYGKVVNALRLAKAMKAPAKTPEIVTEDTKTETEDVACEPVVPKRRKWFGLFGKKKA